ncbi:MAG: hypothetical protein J6C46_00160 [Clostridia bacterium]|nr:hypothetical protein [Clostridia bacterium]
MLSLNTRQAYSEVDEFLELLDEEFKNKVPENFRKFLKNEKDRNYKKNINPKLPIVEQNLKREALAIIAFINLQYWCEDEKEKHELIKIYKDNEKIYKKEIYRIVNDTENINNTVIEENENKDINNMVERKITEYKKESIFKKIVNRILSFFS